MYHTSWYVCQMDRHTAIERIHAALESEATETVNTSMRIPASLRDAATLAVDELGAAVSTTALTVDALRHALEAIAVQGALDHHYALHTTARPSLGELGVAAALLDGHPLANRPDLLHQAAIEIQTQRPLADADDVLLWAEARQYS
jgi:hypothetical protein